METYGSGESESGLSCSSSIIPSSQSAATHICLVCEHPLRHNGSAPVCDACKKFYRRYRDSSGQSLRCLSGTKMCTVQAAKKGTSIASGIYWRMLCPYCRFRKCLRVDIAKYMRRYRLIARAGPLVNFENQFAETAARQIISATYDISATFCTLPMRSGTRQFKNDFDAWFSLMELFDTSAKAIMAFIKAMPGFDVLPEDVKSSSLVLAEIWPSIFFVETNRLNYMPLGISEGHAIEIMKVLPEIHLICEYCRSLSAALSAWNPNLSDFACLLALLYLNCSSSLVQCLLKGSGDLVGLRMVELGIEALLRKAPAFDQQKNKQCLDLAVTVATQAASCRQSAFAELASRRSHLFALTTPTFDDYNSAIL